MREIGSEYHYEKLIRKKSDILSVIKNVNDEAMVFSGRTAIETVLKNIPHVKKAILPSYCCDSMIEPFRKANIVVDFYDVNFDNGMVIDINIEEDVDLILWCNYFGFKIDMPDLSIFLKRGGIIVEDITHSFFSQMPFHNESQYVVASLRKWGALLCGGYCAATNGVLGYKPNKIPPQEFLLNKKHAMLLKKDYLMGNETIHKSDFLDKFSDSNNWLSNNYSGLTMDDESLSIFEKINSESNSQDRKRNAKILYAGLKNHPFIRFLFDEQDMDCPLFVPIVVEKDKREMLRKKLIENEIYCPVHWPKPKEKCKSNLYDLELSLICDQRYDEMDMQRIVSTICSC